MTILRGPADADHYRVKVGRYNDRWYADPLPTDAIAEATDASWPSVSTVKKGAGGQDWTFVGLKRVAQALEANPQVFDGLPYDERYDKLKSINTLGLKRAGARGTNVHAGFEAGLHGRPIQPLFPGEPGAEYFPAIRSFFDAYQPELIAAELVCINRGLHEVGYGGTGDAIIKINGDLWWVDWKSRGEDSDHGAYPEEAAQIAAYAAADYMIVEREEGPTRSMIPRVAGGLIVSIKPDGYRCYPVDLDKAGAHWVSLHEWWVARQSERKSIGKPWAPRKVEKCSSDSSAGSAGPPATSPVPNRSGGQSQSSASTPSTSASDAVTSTPTAASSTSQRRSQILARLTALPEAQKTAIRNAWPAHIASLKLLSHDHTDAELDEIERLIEQCRSPEPATTSTGARYTPRSTKFSSEHASSALQVAMHPTVHSKDTTGSSSRIPVDEGPLVDPADVEALRKKVTKLDVGERAWLAMVGSQCAKAGYSVNLGQNPTKRRWTIGRAMLHCARIGAKSVDDYDQVARQLLAVVLGTDAAQFLNVTLGQCFAALTIDEASLLGDLAAAEDLTILVTDDGLELSGPAVERAQKIA